MLDTMTLKNMTTRKMLELKLQLEKEIEFRNDVRKDLEENQKKMRCSADDHTKYKKNREECLAEFIKWRSSFAG